MEAVPARDPTGFSKQALVVEDYLRVAKIYRPTAHLDSKRQYPAHSDDGAIPVSLGWSACCRGNDSCGASQSGLRRFTSTDQGIQINMTFRQIREKRNLFA